mmetsp:Transcript_3215/g.5014  ORF Transcript_3215/g.5014 Transcript_3215/m.5014 type:complete len:202 (-) Transcript_3215:837-1442(-)
MDVLLGDGFLDHVSVLVRPGQVHLRALGGDHGRVEGGARESDHDAIGLVDRDGGHGFCAVDLHALAVDHLTRRHGALKCDRGFLAAIDDQTLAFPHYRNTRPNTPEHIHRLLLVLHGDLHHTLVRRLVLDVPPTRCDVEVTRWRMLGRIFLRGTTTSSAGGFGGSRLWRRGRTSTGILSAPRLLILRDLLQSRGDSALAIQ